MPTAVECVCCSEIQQMTDMLQDIGSDISCITQHERFEAVCLKSGFFKLPILFIDSSMALVRFGISLCMSKSLCMLSVCTLSLHIGYPCCRQYRFIAYCQLNRWCWGWLGKNVRVVLPSCAVEAIRKKFPSEHYTG